MSSITTSTTTADSGGVTPITAIHPDIIQSLILNRLDGPTLASTSCASSQLLALCQDEYLWRDICNATWPSTAEPRVASAISEFPSGHRSFYSDSFPTTRPSCNIEYDLIKAFTKNNNSRVPNTCEKLISAVDIFYEDKLVYSKVLVTETRSSWFLGTPFRLDLLDQKEIVHTPLKFNDNIDPHQAAENGRSMDDKTARLKVSWIWIDPINKRAVNVASREALEARRHWLTDDLQFRYVTVMACPSTGCPVQCAVLVTCGGKEGGDVHVREVSLQLEDMEGKILCGRDSLVILREAMEGQRCKSDGRSEKYMYEMFLKMRLQHNERKQRREKSLDMMCIATGVLIFFAICVIFLRR